MDEKYQKIIEITQEIRTELANDLADKIAFGEDPGDIKGELSTLGIIVGQCAGILIKHDNNCITPIPGRDKYVNIVLNGIKYPVLKENIPGFAGYHIDNGCNMQPTPQIEEKVVINTEEKVVEKTVNIDIPQSNFATLGGEEQTKDVPKNEEINTTDISPKKIYDFSNEENKEPVVEEEYVFKPTYNIEPATETTNINEDDEEQEDEVSSKPTISSGAKIIGGIPNIGNTNRAEIFIEEKSKNEDEFVIDTYKINIAHSGCKAEEMYFTIAPLKIYKMGSANVPIIVSIYYKGKTINVSSYDKRDNNRVMVSAEVNEYYFLCRGWFTDEGEFKSSISTTGLSTDTGDRLNILSHKEYHNVDNLENIRNGHIKFNYTGDQGDSIIEIFPLDLDSPSEDRNEFLIMNRTGEFVDYYNITKGSRGVSRAILWNSDGEKSEIVCNWNGDRLETDIVPV